MIARPCIPPCNHLVMVDILEWLMLPTEEGEVSIPCFRTIVPEKRTMASGRPVLSPEYDKLFETMYISHSSLYVGNLFNSSVT